MGSSSLRDRRKRHDGYYRRAQKQNYPARSVFKLEQIDQRFRLLKPGQRVLDLGCRPGSWLLYAAQRVGPKGTVVGIDRQPLSVSLPANACTVTADLLETDRALLARQIGADEKPFDIILSDMAPDTTGIAFTDQVRSVALFELAVDLALTHGRPGSSFVGKVFMGEGFSEAVALVKKNYRRAQTVKPDATRKTSTELYIIALDLKR